MADTPPPPPNHERESAKAAEDQYKNSVKVPIQEKLLYGVGSGSFQMATSGVQGLANPIYNILLHLDPSKIGMVFMLSRLFDAFTDPLMGSISDNTRSRWGRRRPYIFVGAFLTAFAFMLIWRADAGWSENKIFVYYLCTMLFFYLCSTIQVIPYHTLGLEMTKDYHERTVISGYKLFFSFVFLLAIPWVFRIAQSDFFSTPMEGVRTTSYFLAAAIILGGVLPALFVKERFLKLASSQRKISFWTAANYTFRNKSFLYLTGIILCVGVGAGTVTALGPYVIYYYMFGGDTKAGSGLEALAANVGSILSFISVPLVTIISIRIGKIRALKLFVILLTVGVASKYFCFNKDYHFLLFVPYILMAPGVVAFWTLTTSMKADICDEDELEHGMRREGMFGAVGNWVLKVAGSSTLLISNNILEWTGFNIELGADQDPQTLQLMRIFLAVVPLCFNLIGLLLIIKYPLTQKRSLQIKEELERRRAVSVDD